MLFPETLALKQRLEDFYGLKIEAIEPDLTVEEQADVHGPELWKRDPDLCCTARKVLPLRGKLEELACWLTGLRRQQSQARAHGRNRGALSFGRGNRPAKSSKSIPWPIGRGSKYGRISGNTRFLTTRCTTRATIPLAACPARAKPREGQDERAGRWIGFKKVECGIHTFLPKKVDFQI